jgi:uncharacterized repeat protein (TIGR01451 family)
MNTNYKTLATSFVLAVMATFVPTVSAYTTCTTQYGGNEVCQPSNLTLDKQVKNPVGDVFVENLTTTDHTFTPGSDVMYRLIIKNGSGETFNPVTVRDTLPAYLEFVSGPGTYNSDTRVLEFKLDNVIAGETRTVEILARVVGADKFPAGKSLFCVVNVAEATAANRRDSDSAQVCLRNGEVARNLPVAGFNDLMILLPFAGVGLGGVALLKGKKKS